MNALGPGLLPGSYYHLPQIALSNREMFYYISICGHFYTDEQYGTVRKAFFAGPLIMCILNGHIRVSIHGNEYIAGPNEVVLINCSEQHGYWANPNAEFIYMHFNGLNSFDLASYIIDQNGGSPVFRVKTFGKIRSLIQGILYKLDYNQPIPDTEYSRVVYNALCYLTYNDSENIAGNEYVSKAIAYIHKNVNLPLKLQDISDYVNVSPYHFSRLFKEEIGMSPMEYVATVKTNAAKTLLKTTSMPISEIAAALGYTNHSSFSNFFIARIGLSPKQFRDSQAL